MISTVILTHNSVATIRKTLESVAWSDEIIVIDDDSTDETKGISRNCGATVYTHTLGNNFSNQRNFGLEKAKNPWVLFVDSDEVVPEELKNEILKEISMINDQFSNNVQLLKTKTINGYYVKRTDVMWGKQLHHGETAHVSLLRLAKNDAGKWIRPVHEIWDVQGKTETLVHPLLHFPHQDVSQFLASVNRYSTLSAQYLHERGEKSSLFQIIAYPTGKFFQNYIFKRGFLDGTPGAIVAIMMSFHSFLTRGKLYLMNRTKPV